MCFTSRSRPGNDPVACQAEDSGTEILLRQDSLLLCIKYVVTSNDRVLIEDCSLFSRKAPQQALTSDHISSCPFRIFPLSPTPTQCISFIDIVFSSHCQLSSLGVFQSFSSIKLPLPLPLTSSLARNSGGTVGIYRLSLSLFTPP